MKISEIFYSFQGEGPSRGIPSIFIRAGGCNLSCGIQSPICDASKATWFCDSYKLWTKAKNKTTTDIINDIENIKKEYCLPSSCHIVFTGGEPCLSQNAEDIISLIDTYFYNQNFILEMETNGTILNKDLLDKINIINCSPKLSNSGILKEKRINVDLLMYLRDRFNINQGPWIKFVVTSSDQWDEIEQDFLPYISRDQIILMPGMEKLSEEATKVSQNVWDLALEKGARFSTREQISVWNMRTGV